MRDEPSPNAVEATPRPPIEPRASRNALATQRIARSARISLDLACGALLAYWTLSDQGGSWNVILFWLLSYAVFPYRRPPARFRHQRAVRWVWVVGTGVMLGLSVWLWQLNRSLATLLLLGVAGTLGGLASLPSASEAVDGGPSASRLLVGFAALAVGGVWLFLTLEAAEG